MRTLDDMINGFIALSVLGFLGTNGGNLIDFMAGKAADAHQRGTISMSSFNRSLQGEKAYCEWYEGMYKRECPKSRKKTGR